MDGEESTAFPTFGGGGGVLEPRPPLPRFSLFVGMGHNGRFWRSALTHVPVIEAHVSTIFGAGVRISLGQAYRWMQSQHTVFDNMYLFYSYHRLRVKGENPFLSE